MTRNNISEMSLRLAVFLCLATSVVVAAAEKTGLRRNLIVGGMIMKDATAYPFYGFPAGPNNCGATLVHSDIMISSALCSKFFSAGVVLGGNTIDGKYGTKIPVIGDFVHPDFNETTLLNDIMLIKLAKPSTATVVKLNSDPLTPTELSGLEIIGYGALNETGSFSPNLMKAKVQTAPPARCSLYSNFVKDAMVCSWFPHGGRDSCKGDTGGPVLIKGTTIQVGIMSFGKGCGHGEYPVSNTRISYHMDYIKKGICEHSSSPPNDCP